MSFDMDSAAPRRYVYVKAVPTTKSIFERIKWLLVPWSRPPTYQLKEVFPGTKEYDEAEVEEMLMKGTAPFKIKYFHV